MLYKIYISYNKYSSFKFLILFNLILLLYYFYIFLTFMLNFNLLKWLKKNYSLIDNWTNGHKFKK